MKIKVLYRHFLEQLKAIYPMQEAAAITDRVFEAVLQTNKTTIITYPDKTIEADEVASLNGMLNELLHHKPVQYVLGKTWFYNLEFELNEHVLIPRPETEELVEWVLKSHENISPETGPAFIDIGTGSGCIAVAVKKNLPCIQMTAIDKSEAALSVAKINASNNSAEIHFKKIDFLSHDQLASLPLYDCIISNPPYIPLNEKEKMDLNVIDFEPGIALFVPDNKPMLFYESIAQFAQTHLKAGGKIFVEIHENYGNETTELFARFYNHVILKKDLFGKDRMLLAFNS